MVKFTFVYNLLHAQRFKNCIDRTERAGEKKQKTVAGHDGHCGRKADNFLKGIRPNYGGTTAMAVVAAVKFLPWHQ